MNRNLHRHDCRYSLLALLFLTMAALSKALKITPPMARFTQRMRNKMNLSSVLKSHTTSSSSSSFTTTTENKIPLCGVIFDMDGTLTKPDLIDFDLMYKRCGIPKEKDILKEILPQDNDSDEILEIKKKQMAIVEEMEEESRQNLSSMAPGALDFIQWLIFHQIQIGLVTRNTEKTVQHMIHECIQNDVIFFSATSKNDDDTDMMKKHKDTNNIFSPCLTRDNCEFPTKPDPAALEFIKKEWGCTGRDDDDTADMGFLMVGDSYVNDVMFGKNAGVTTCLVDYKNEYYEKKEKNKQTTTTTTNNDDQSSDPDMIVTNLSQLPSILWQNFIIDGDLGTKVDTSQMKFPVPVPSPECSKIVHAVTSKAPWDKNTENFLKECNENEELWKIDPVTKNTPLIWAADAGNLEAVHFLLSTISDINNKIDKSQTIDVKGYLGATALSRACRRGYLEIVQELLQNGCGINIPNDKMQYPLHFAAFQRHKDVVELLLKYKGNTYVLDRKGRTPVEDTSDKEISELILKAR